MNNHPEAKTKVFQLYSKIHLCPSTEMQFNIINKLQSTDCLIRQFSMYCTQIQSVNI